MPRPTVEDAGGELGCGCVHKLIRRGHRSGTATLGGETVRWAAAAGVVTVCHPHAADPSAAGPYTVARAFTALPSGGSRAWWVCPGCGRRADSLYLPPGRDRLGCRRCCGLTYASRLTRVRGGPRKGRPATTLTHTVLRPVIDPRTGRRRFVEVSRSARRL